MKRYKVKNKCRHCGTHEEYFIDAEDKQDAEMSMVNFDQHKEWLGRLENDSVEEV